MTFPSPADILGYIMRPVVTTQFIMLFLFLSDTYLKVQNSYEIMVKYTKQRITFYLSTLQDQTNRRGGVETRQDKNGAANVGQPVLTWCWFTQEENRPCLPFLFRG